MKPTCPTYTWTPNKWDSAGVDFFEWRPFAQSTGIGSGSFTPIMIFLGVLMS